VSKVSEKLDVSVSCPAFPVAILNSSAICSRNAVPSSSVLTFATRCSRFLLASFDGPSHSVFWRLDGDDSFAALDPGAGGVRRRRTLHVVLRR
jgi:hypothetical protein